jgi:hypothetical protein
MCWLLCGGFHGVLTMANSYCQYSESLEVQRSQDYDNGGVARSQ